MGMGKPDGLRKAQQLDGVFFSFKLLLLLLLCKQVSSQCKILRCNSGFVAATLNLRGSSKNAAYCNALRSYSSCTRKTSHTCRGDLTYHSAVHGIEDLMSQHNCSKDGPVSPPRLRPPLPNREGLELPDVCNYERNFHFKHGKNTSYVYCGVFGDPHMRTFYNEFQTCKIKGAWPLIDNNYLAVQVTNTPVRKDSNATVTSKLTVIFKNVKECIDQKVYQAETDNVPAAFDDGSANGGERQGGNSLTINEKVPERHIEIKAAYIGTTIIVRQVGDHLSFAIRMPEEVATAFTEEQDLQLCVHGCPYNEQIHIMPPPTISSLVSMETARTKCKEKLPVEDAYFQSCVFDVLMLEDTNYTLAAYNAFEDTKTLHPDSEKLHIFKNHVQGCPPLSVSLFIVSLFAGLLVQLI